MSVLLMLQMVNFISPSLADLRNVQQNGLSLGLGEENGSVWWPLLRSVFRKAKSVQVIRLSSSGSANTSSLWSDLIPSLHRRLNATIVVWDASDVDIYSSVYDQVGSDHPEMGFGSEDGHFFLLLIESSFLHQLTHFDIWFTQGYYVILVENRNLLQDSCSKDSATVARQLWNSHRVPYVCFVLRSCIDRAYMYEPFEGTGSNIMLNIYNITLVLSLWERIFSNMNHFEWKVAMFERYPTAVKVHGSKQKLTDFEGIDGFLLEALSKHYNIRPVVIEPQDGQTYGAYENDNATGTLGMVLRGEVEISMNGRFLIDYGTREMAFTTPYLTDKLCIMAPRSKRVPSYIAMFRCFDKPAWVLLAITYLLGTLLWRYVRGFEYHGCSKKSDQFLAPRDVYYMLLAGLIFRSAPRTTSARIFITSCLLFNAVFMGAFQGLLYKSMTSPLYYPEIDTLEDVDRSNLPIVTGSASLKNAFPEDDDSPLMTRLRSKLYVVRNETEWNKIQKDESNYASLWRLNSAYLRLHRSGTKLHRVDECPRSFFLSFLVRKRSPFLRIVDSFILRCGEHGLLKLWYDRTYRFTARDLQVQTTLRNSDMFVVSLEEVQPPFFLLSIGLSASILVFVYERFNRGRLISRPDINISNERS